MKNTWVSKIDDLSPLTVFTIYMTTEWKIITFSGEHFSVYRYNTFENYNIKGWDKIDLYEYKTLYIL